MQDRPRSSADGANSENDVFDAVRPADRRMSAVKLLPGSTSALPPLGSKPSNTLPSARRHVLATSKSIKEGLWKVQPAPQASRIVVNAPGPKEQQTVDLAVQPSGRAQSASDSMKRSASVAGLRSPPPKPAGARPRRSVVGGPALEHDDFARPTKRAFLGSQYGLSTVAQSREAVSSQSSRQTAPLKPRRSIVFPAPGVSNTGHSIAGGSSGLPPPRRVSLAPPVPSSGLVGLSPSKFGLTVPREFSFTPYSSDSSLNRPLASSSSAQPARSAHLAPSPIRADEHIPKPISRPIQRSQTVSTSLATYAGDRSGQPGSPGQSRQLELKQHGFPTERASTNPFSSPIKEMQSVKPRTSLSPAQKEDMLRSDLMWRTIEKSGFSPTGKGRTAPAAPLPSLGTSTSLSALSGSPPLAAPAELQASSSLKRARSPSSDQLQGPQMNLLGFSGQPLRVPAKPLRRSSTMGNIRSTGGMTRSMSTRSVTRRAAGLHAIESSRRPPVHNVAPAKPLAEEDMLVEELRDVAPGNAAPTSPTSSTITGSASKTSSPDRSMSLVSMTAPDVDTSIMSATGQESLVNLDNLLSKLSLPSRRSSGIHSLRKSYAGPSMNLLDERAELEAEKMAHPRGDRQLPAPRRIPGYLAGTASSNAKRSFGPEDQPIHGQPDRSAGPERLNTRVTVAAPGYRRPSVTLPATRRGSLLPLASSSNAAHTALKTSTTLSGSLNAASLSGNPSVVVEGILGDSTMQKESVTLPAPPSQSVLRNVVAYIDVKTSEGDEAGGVFVDILRSLGARILTRPTDRVTHIVFKNGKAATLHRYRAYEENARPHLVGVGWIVRCKENNEWAEEKPFLINPDTVDGVLLSTTNALASKANRRQSLEPRMLLAPPQAQYGRWTLCPKGTSGTDTAP